ncbi:MAG TPA: GNAT family N-acetyltransferase [Oscillatoriaceae cyanobacterium]
MPDYCIREAGPEDLDRLVELTGRLMADQARYVRTFRWNKANRARVRAHLTHMLAHGQVLVLETADGLMGYAKVSVNLPPLETHYASAAISDLYLEPQVRGRGWGRALLDAAIALIAGRGLHAVSITFASGNEAAAALYRARGFRANTETLILPLEPGYVRFGPEHPEA